jgi:hypothetical protein
MLWRHWSRQGAGAGARAAEAVALLGGPVAAVALATGGRRLAATAIAGAVTIAAVFFFHRVSKARFSVGLTLLSALGLPLFAWLLLRSQTHHERGIVTWKGRTYRGALPAQLSTAELTTAETTETELVTGSEVPCTAKAPQRSEALTSSASA